MLLGTTSLARAGDGETIGIARVISYPSSQSSIDISVLVLDRPARETPRAIATGWARFDIVDGARIELVGYGAVDMAGNQYVNELQQARTTITDANLKCSNPCNTGKRTVLTPSGRP